MKPQKKQRLFELSTATQTRLLHLIADKSTQVSKLSLSTHHDYTLML